MKYFFLLSVLVTTAQACSTATPFEQVGVIKSEKVKEASGIDFSRQHKDVFWVHNDSGDTPVIYAIGMDGKKRAELTVNTPVNDWEDISVGKCLGMAGDCIYISDTGNKKGKREVLNVLMIQEPAVLQDADVTVAKTISFNSNAENLESLAFDEKREVFYLLSKKGRRFDPIDQKKGLITLYSLSPVNSVLTPMSVLDFTKVPKLEAQDTLVTAADFDSVRDMLLIGTYGKAFEIKLSDLQNFAGAVLTHELPPMDKAEAMAFYGNDIVVTSEGKNPPLYRLHCQ